MSARYVGRTSLLLAMPIFAGIQTAALISQIVTVAMGVELSTKLLPPQIPSASLILDLKTSIPSLINLLSKLPDEIAALFPPKPPIMATFTFNASLPGAILALRAAIDATISVIDTAGICLYEYDGAYETMGSELSDLVRTGLPDGTRRSQSCYAIAIVATEQSSRSVVQSTLRSS